MFGANVIFEIKMETDLNIIIYACIVRMSINPSEDEVLFDFGAIFQSIFGKFLLIIDSNKKAIDYFEELYKNSLSNNNNNNRLLNEYETYIITGNLADAYAQNGQYDLILKYAFDCQQVLEKFTETINSVSLNETHYTLVEIYQNQSNNNLTIEHYEKSLLFQNYLFEKYDLSSYYHLEILNNK
ncbi:unnamed protein product [Rotaria sordida]|nr:unnamed protein product [Rotaria sordida]